MAQTRGSSGLAAKIVSVLMALLFLFAGGGKLAGGQSHAEQFAHWGYPVWFMYVIGALEVAGGIGLLIPAVRFWAAALLACNMAGAVVTHLRAGEYMNLPLPALFLLSAILLAWLHRPASAKSTQAAAAPESD